MSCNNGWAFGRVLMLPDLPRHQAQRSNFGCRDGAAAAGRAIANTSHVIQKPLSRSLARRASLIVELPHQFLDVSRNQAVRGGLDA